MIRLGLLYGIPHWELRHRMPAIEYQRLIAAAQLGLIPDPWLQTARICKTIYDTATSRDAPPLTELDWIPTTPRRRAAARAARRQDQAAAEEAAQRRYGQEPSPSPSPTEPPTA